MALPHNKLGQLTEVFLRRFLLLFDWLEDIRDRITWKMQPSGTISRGGVLFDEEPIATLTANGSVKLELHGPKLYRYIASIEEILLPDIAEAVALLALDLGELRTLGVRRASSPNAGFREAVSLLARRMRSDPTLSSAYQLSVLRGTSPPSDED